MAAAPTAANTGLPDPATIAGAADLFNNKGFMGFMANGTPEERKARIEAIIAMTKIAPAMTGGAAQNQKK